MSKSFDSSIPSDICLLLRADAEQCWLSREVIPVLRHLEARELLPDEEVRAALAYLEAMWDEATLRARETDAAHAHLHAHGDEPAALSGPAGRYHAAVRVLRGVVAKRVTPFVETSSELDVPGGRHLTARAPLGTHAGEHQARPDDRGVRVKDERAGKRRPSAGGYTPRAA